MKKSVILTIIVVFFISFLAGIGAYKGYLHIANLETISASELEQKEHEITALNKKVKEISEITKSVEIDKDAKGRFFCVASGRSEIRGSQMIAFQKAKMDANVKLVEAIYGVQITNEIDNGSSKSTSKSIGTLKGVVELERNIIDDSIAEVKLQVFFDEQ